MRPMYSDGTGAPTNGYCQCAPATSWGDVPLIDWRDAELSRLRIQVEQMRIDTIKDREAFAAKLVIEADTLRAELAEARADVARFEAALDVANRELAEARRERDLAQKGEENLRYLKKLWEQECGYYMGLWREKSHECNRNRRTIRALVVAARAIHRTLWSALDQYEVNDRGIEREMRQHVIGLRWEIQQAERGQAKE